MYNKKLVFISACLGMLLFGISLITLGSIATSLKTKFDLGSIGSGTLFSILPIGILTGSLLFGPICDRYGYKLLLTVASLAMFAGFQGIAYANSLGLLKICIYIFGVGGGIINGATNAVVADISTKNPGSNLSLLGVFFGLGALGMPLLLGALDSMHPLRVVSAVGFLALLPGLIYSIINFPPAKQKKGSEKINWPILFKWVLLFIAFFLFCQSSLEAILNNWTITYLTSRKVMSDNASLYALSIHISGMIAMRLLCGSVFRSASQVRIMWYGLSLLLIGIFLMQWSNSIPLAMIGLFLSGAGLAQGFPVMLGFVSERFSSLSGTAFSFVFVVALVGNILVNYLMGLIVHHYGINHLATVAYSEVAIMGVLFILITKQLKST